MSASSGGVPRGAEGVVSRLALWHESAVPRELLPIGSFASRGRLSVEALRHDAEFGLLHPAHVDVVSEIGGVTIFALPADLPIYVDDLGIRS